MLALILCTLLIILARRISKQKAGRASSLDSLKDADPSKVCHGQYYMQYYLKCNMQKWTLSSSPATILHLSLG